MLQINIYLLITICTLFGQVAYSQNSDYIATDSSVTSGIKLVKGLDKENAQFIRVKAENEVLKYSPAQLKEYGFKNGEVYVAFDVVINGKNERYFLKRVVNGGISLFYLKLKAGVEKYYILSDESTDLIELPMNKSEILRMLETYADGCSSSAQNLKFVKPNRSSLTRFLNYLNNCSTYPYPKVRYSIKIGIAGTNFYPIDKGDIYAVGDYKSDLSIRVGASLDVPVLSSDFSCAPEIYFKRNHSASKYEDNKRFDLILNYSSLNFPLLFKYRFMKEGNIPFIQFGPLYSRVIKNSAVLYDYQVILSTTYIETNENPILQKNMAGFSLGSGLQLNSDKRYRWFGEAGYNHLFNLNSEGNNFTFGEFYFSVGLQF